MYDLSEPMKMTDHMLNWPCCTIITGYILMLVASVFVFEMGWLTPNNPDDRDFMVWGNPYLNNFDKTKLVQ